MSQPILVTEEGDLRVVVLDSGAGLEPEQPLMVTNPCSRQSRSSPAGCPARSG